MSDELALLGDIATLQAGFGFPPCLHGRTSGQYPFAKVGDISRGGRSESSILLKADHYVDAADLATLRAKVVARRTELVRRSPFAGEFGCAQAFIRP